MKKKISSPRGLRTWVEIDRHSIKKNYAHFRSHIPPTCRLMSVVKSNAYGHGLVDFAQEVAQCGVDWFGVDSLVEALSLRAAGIQQPILVLGHTLAERIPEAFAHGVSITVADMASLREALKHGKKIPSLHIKIDTGMGRQGFLPHERDAVLSLIKKHADTVEGIYTHFAAAKNPAFPADTQRQIAVFTEWGDAFAQMGLTPIKHACATSGTLLYPQAHFDMVRVGIGMYGLWPSKEVRAYAEGNAPLKPVLSWKTLVASIKELPKGSTIGYDMTEVCSKRTRTAILPVGYWHGYPRILSSIGSVLIQGKPARILGRISMDMIVVDITNHKDVQIGDVVTLIGADGAATLSAEDVGTLSDTINYEIVTRINPLIQRIIR